MLILVALAMMLPFLWMVLASFKSIVDVENTNPWPGTWHRENYGDVFKTPHVSFARYYFNSAFVAVWVTFALPDRAMAAYAFAQLRWPRQRSSSCTSRRSWYPAS